MTETKQPSEATSRGDSTMPPLLLEVTGLRMHFPLRANATRRRVGVLRAVDGVDLQVRKGETLGVVGESGSGKTTMARAILQLHRPSAGSVLFDSVELTRLGQRDLRHIRRRMQMIFQDPYSTLDPRMRVRQILAEPMKIHGTVHGNGTEDKVAELLRLVGLDRGAANRYPHEFSGGQRQRIGIARALAVRPEFIVADEPISGLDVSIQAQIVNLLKDLQEEFQLTYLFISHDIAALSHVANRISVMYLGRIVELAENPELFIRPLHPYTQALLSAVPVPDPLEEATRKRIILSGSIPSPLEAPSGCPFRTRCWKAAQICIDETPSLDEHSPGHYAACHFAGVRGASGDEIGDSAPLCEKV
jgi:oligopeptide transport system ATP-binding protein